MHSGFVSDCIEMGQILWLGDYIFYDFILVHLLVTVTKYLTRSFLRREVFVLAYSLRKPTLHKEKCIVVGAYMSIGMRS